MNVSESLNFEIHQGTQRVPRNTVTVANISYMHITIRNLGIVSGLSFFFFLVHEGVMGEEKFRWIPLILKAMKLPFLPSVRPMRKCRVGKKTSPNARFYHGQTGAAFPRYLNSSRFPHCSVQTVLMMSSRTSP